MKKGIARWITIALRKQTEGAVDTVNELAVGHDELVVWYVKEGDIRTRKQVGITGIIDPLDFDNLVEAPNLTPADAVGVCKIKFSASELDTKGRFQIWVTLQGAQAGTEKIFYGEEELTDYDVDDVAGAIGTVDGKVDAVGVIAGNIQERTDNLPDDPTSEITATANKDEIIEHVDDLIRYDGFGN